MPQAIDRFPSSPYRSNVPVRPNRKVQACTTILVGQSATADGSVMMATSCDGNVMGRIHVRPACDYSGNGGVPMFFDFPAPSTKAEHDEQMAKGETCVGNLPLERTCRCILASGHLADSVTGGMNEHGLSMGIEYLTMKPELVSKRGVVSTCSSHWTTSLIANGLLRAKTARDAIRLMGAMVEKYGFTYYWAPEAGCAIPVVDKTEAWIMEIFGPGEQWTPDSGKPGAVWCAQRVPDGELTCNANRSRIGCVDPDNPDEFMTSPNVYSLAEKLGLWQPGTPFVWRDAYGTPGARQNCLREWAILNAVAPSLGLEATGAPEQDRFPFSVKPDAKIDVPKLASIMRDGYEGTQFDVTEQPAFNPDGKKSPLARPFGSRDLFDLLGVQRERCVGTETSGYVYISQIRDRLPDPIAGCMWVTLGPTYAGCFTPVYAGVAEIVDSWSRQPDFARIDRTQIQWKFQLLASLADLKYQEAIEDVRGVFGPAEAGFLAHQNELEAAVTRAFEEQGAEAAARLVTSYTNSCLESVDAACGKLVECLELKYLYHFPKLAPPEMPAVNVPPVPDPDTPDFPGGR